MAINRRALQLRTSSRYSPHAFPLGWGCTSSAVTAWGLLVALSSVFGAQGSERRFGSSHDGCDAGGVSIDMLAGASSSTSSWLIVVVVVSGALSGSQPVMTEGVMDAAGRRATDRLVGLQLRALHCGAIAPCERASSASTCRRVRQNDSSAAGWSRSPWSRSWCSAAICGSRAEPVMRSSPGARALGARGSSHYRRARQGPRSCPPPPASRGRADDGRCSSRRPRDAGTPEDAADVETPAAEQATLPRISRRSSATASTRPAEVLQVNGPITRTKPERSSSFRRPHKRADFVVVGRRRATAAEPGARPARALLTDRRHATSRRRRARAARSPPNRQRTQADRHMRARSGGIYLCAEAAVLVMRA